MSISYHNKQHRTPWQRAWDRFSSRKLNLFALAVVTCYILLALLAYGNIVVATWDQTLLPLRRHAAPSWIRWGGTDFHGRDVLAKTIKGTQSAIGIGCWVGILSTLLGLLLGALAGYYQGWLDHLIMWLTTTLASVPSTMFLIALTLALGKSLFSIYAGLITIFYIPVCRLVRAEVMRQRDLPYVEAATAIGAGDMRKLWVHILPNIIHIVILQFSLVFQAAIKTEVILSYLALGPQYGCSWGTMVGDAKVDLQQGYWWEAAFATFAMSLIVLALNILGEGIREALDPEHGA